MTGARRNRMGIRGAGLVLGLVGSLGAVAAGCGNAFDSQASVQSLRAFAVKITSTATNPDGSPRAPKVDDQAYVTPGASDVTLDLLYWDQSPRALVNGVKRPLDIRWLAVPDKSALLSGDPNAAPATPACINPKGDLYYGCVAQFAAALSGGGSAPGGGGLPAGVNPLDFLPHGPHLSLHIPTDIISSRPTPQSPTIPYGLSYVFWFICGGELRALPNGEMSQGVPIGCFDPKTNAQLGTDDFIVGYTPVYAYDIDQDPSSYPTPIESTNPKLTGIQWEGDDSAYKIVEGTNQTLVPAACPADGSAPPQGTVCSCKPEDGPHPFACKKEERCGSNGYCIPVVPHCTAQKTLDCPTYKLRPLIDPSVVEADKTSPPVNGVTPSESIWVAYYATQGSMKIELRLVNDSVRGWQDNFGGEWSAPNAASGEARLWAVVHDNRGGTAWWWQDVFID